MRLLNVLKKSYFTMFVLLLCLLVSSSAYTQSNYGAVRGIVADAQGAAIPKARVELTSESTFITRVTVTNGFGEYSFSAVDPGTYTVTELTHKGIVVDSGNTIPVDVTLAIGSASQAIEVVASNF